MQKAIRTISILSMIEGLLAFAWLASIPTGDQNGGFVFSPSRLISLIGVLAISAAYLAVFLYFRSESRSARAIDRITRLNGRSYIAFGLISFVIVWSALLFKDQWLIHISDSLYTRLTPPAILVTLVCFQTGLVLLLPDLDQDIEVQFQSIWKPATLVFSGLVAMWIFISSTRIGLTFDNVGLSWGPPGTPITFAQVNLVLITGFLLWLGFQFFGTKIRPLFAHLPFARDIIIFLGLWGLAVFVWWQQPMSPTHFSPSPMAPNNEYYPFSDAALFDKSSYHLIYGAGFNDQLIRRPLYVGMLALFHKIAGPGYDPTVFWQILLLALIPSLVYLFTSKLSNRLAGLIAGGLILLRESNAIELSGKIVTSHAKLLMSDLPATLGIILFMIVTVNLLSSKDERSLWLPATAGACLGLTALIRAQALILLPLLILFIFITRKAFKPATKESIAVLLGILLVILPWAWRNWTLTGTFVLDDRGEERLLARNYSTDPVSYPSPLPGETEADFSERLKQNMITFVIEHPGDTLFFISNHFFHNLATSALFIAPVYSTDSPEGVVDQMPLWGEWDGRLTGNSNAALFANLVIVAFGIAILQGKNKHVGWYPASIFLLYCGGNALVRSSGWRFSLPVDWIVIVYFSVALAYLPSRIKFLSDQNQQIQVADSKAPATKNKFIEPIIFILLLLVGASVPIAERMVPAQNFDRFTPDAQEMLTQAGILSPAEVDTFLEEQNAVFLSGVALYPRYIGQNSRVNIANMPDEYRYLHFWLINDGDEQIVLPLNSSPDVFPHTATVSILGCRGRDYIVAWAVIILAPAQQIILQDPQAPLDCSQIK